MDKQKKVRPFHPGSYVFRFIFFTVIIILITGTLLCWFKFFTWSKVIPYTIETTIVTDENKALNGEEMKWFSFPFTLSQNIIVNSEDLDTLYDRLEEHIDGYISFSITVLSIAFAAFGVVVPLYNYFFLQKDIVKGVQQYADELARTTDLFIEELESKKNEYKSAIASIEALSTKIGEAQDDLKEAQDNIETLQTNFNGLMSGNDELSGKKEKRGEEIGVNKTKPEQGKNKVEIEPNSIDVTANPELDDMRTGGKA